MTYLESHPSSDVLEQYSFRQLSYAKVEQIEEHLLVCGACQDELEKVESFIGDMKYACANARSVVENTEEGFLALLLAAVPRPALAAAFAALLLVIGIPVTHQTAATGDVIAVELTSLRGGEQSGTPHVPANHALELKLDGTGTLIEGVTSRGVKIVDAGGHLIWEGTAHARGTTLVVNVQHSLRSGDYWVRLINAESEPIREYGLTVK